MKKSKKKDGKNANKDDDMDVDDVHIKIEEEDNEEIVNDIKEEEIEYSASYRKSDIEKLLDYDIGISCAPKTSVPMASFKLHQQILKLIKQSYNAKACFTGIKNLAKAIRKNKKGICILAGNVSPVDIIIHFPILCEENDIPYIYLPTKEMIGNVVRKGNIITCVLICPDSIKEDSITEKQTKKFLKLFHKIKKKLKKLNKPKIKELFS